MQRAYTVFVEWPRVVSRYAMLFAPALKRCFLVTESEDLEHVATHFISSLFFR
jgi:hypothetical protein